jgi:hypothetical protein
MASRGVSMILMGCKIDGKVNDFSQKANRDILRKVQIQSQIDQIQSLACHIIVYFIFLIEKYQDEGRW